jgi:hypothetical protein
MEIGAVLERVGHISAVRSDPAADADLVQSGLVAIREVQAWCDAQHAGLVARLRDVDSFPEQRIAKASMKSLGQAAKSTERSNTLEQTPNLAAALDDGAITADHVDAVTRATKQLDGARRSQLIERADALAEVARAGTVDEFTRRLDLERKLLQADDGMDRLARQRRNVRARSWVDLEEMWNLAAKFDPVTGVRVAARIDAMVQSMFAKTVPDECPTDPIEKQRYLAAHATARLLLDEALDEALDDRTDNEPADGARPAPSRLRPGRSEFVAVIDADAPGHTGPVVEFSIPVESPLACSPPSPATPTSTPSSYATASCCTPPANSTSDAAPASPTAPSAERCAASTNTVPSPAAASPTTAANSTTSSGGATKAEPT